MKRIYSEHKYALRLMGVSDFSVVNQYPYPDLISSLKAAKPPIKSLSEKRLLKKLNN